MTAALEDAREAYRRHDWVGAYDGFTRARGSGALSADDLDTFADAAWWLGRTDEVLALCEEAYQLYLDGGNAPAAARLAMGTGFLSFLRGDAAIGSGWIGRARRLLRDAPECVEHGYLLGMDVDMALGAGDYDAAIMSAHEVQAVARRFRDRTLGAMALVSEGIALVKRGDVADGLAVLDEAMLPVLAGHVEPSFAGNIYCQLMGICHEVADLPRARQWTAATERWCAGFPVAVMFAGICRVHRVQLLQVQGEWQRAEQEAVRVCEELATMNVAVVAEAHYQLGELHRLRGDDDAADAAYRRAHQLGRSPQPGLALLRLAQGKVEAASAAIRSALTAGDRLARAPTLVAQVEIAIAAADLATASTAADELDALADTYRSVGFLAWARHARGAVLLAREKPEAALPVLQDACRRWRELEAPYELARVQLLLAGAYAALDDEDAADLERDAAAATFRRLGAAESGRRAALPGGLTAREAEVLAHVAAGRSNREIANALVISEKTVARHLSNIFTKIDVGSRTEAAAYAFGHDLASRRRW